MEAASSAEFGRVPPHSIEAEQSLLGGILVDNSGLINVLDLINGEEFYREAHHIIFRAMLDLFEKNDPIDLLTVTDLLTQKQQIEAVGGVIYLAHLTELMGSAANVETYAKIIREKALLRRLIQGAHAINALSYGGGKDVEEVIDSAESIIFAIAEKRIRSAYSPLKVAIKSNLEAIDRLQEYRDAVTGIPSCYKDLDALTAGFQRSDLIIIAARPSMGKTALSLCIAANAAKEKGHPVGIFSLEMSKEQLSMRLLCSEARVDSHKIRTGFLGQHECAKLVNAAGNLIDVPIFIDDTPAITPLELRAKARRMKMSDHGLDMVIVDYLQLMKGRESSERREQEISDISRSLKGLAKELNVPVIALSQLNRKVEERNDKRPLLSDLRESGAIEQDADVILFIYRDEVYHKDTNDKGIAEVLIGKQRNGPSGKTVRLAYIDTYTRFENLAAN